MTIQKEISIKTFIYLIVLYASSFFLFRFYPHILVAIYGFYLLKKKNLLAVQTILIFILSFHISFFLALISFSSTHIQFYVILLILTVAISFILLPIKNYFLKILNEKFFKEKLV